MSDEREMLPQAHFGPPEQPPPDWRRQPDRDPIDDDQYRKPAPSFLKLLGLDPLRLFAPRRGTVDDGRE